MHQSSVNDARIMRYEGYCYYRFMYECSIKYPLSLYQQLFLEQYTITIITTSDGTGPYSLNGVPLRRVNQKYVIATSTKVNLTSAVTALTSKIDDAFFAREKGAKPTEEVNIHYIYIHKYKHTYISLRIRFTSLKCSVSTPYMMLQFFIIWNFLLHAHSSMPRARSPRQFPPQEKPPKVKWTLLLK